jgi:hypothetical protein
LFNLIAQIDVHKIKKYDFSKAEKIADIINIINKQLIDIINKQEVHWRQTTSKTNFIYINKIFI